MRELTNSEREIMQVPLSEYWAEKEGLTTKGTRDFEAGFTGGLDTAAEQVAALETQLRAESAERDGLRAALKPFARIADLTGFPKGINVTLWERTTNVEGETGIAITLADCIEARRVMEGSEK